MVNQRNRILELNKYIETQGVTVNIGKNKARGNKGFFCSRNGKLRIDIAKELSEEFLLSTLLHEFTHYIHYKYDNTLQSLDFLFGEISDIEQEELIKITVRSVPKDYAAKLYDIKEQCISENKKLSNNIKRYYPEFKMSSPFKPLEKSYNIPEKYLLKYDRISWFNKIYSINSIDGKRLSESQLDYLRLKSSKRKLHRVNSAINRLNRYYNQPSELLARFCELYFTKQETAENIAPTLSKKFSSILQEKKIKEFSKIQEILTNIY